MIFRVAGRKMRIEENRIKEDKRAVERDVKEYLKGKNIPFDYEVDFSSFTSFQRKVLREMRKIPYGETSTYGELASKAGHPKAFRAVGSVCAMNPLPIIIPCHRVLSSSGLGGYSGGLEVKKHLLRLEGVL